MAELVNMLQRAIPLWERLVELYPTVKGFTSDLAGYYFIHGMIAVAGVGNLESKPWFEKAAANWEKLDRDFLGPTRSYLLAVCHNNLCFVVGRIEQNWESALRHSQRAVEILSVPDRYPEGYLRALAMDYQWVAKCADALGRRELAIDSSKNGQSIYTQLIEDHPNDFDLWNGRGRFYAQLAQWEQAAADFTKAVELNTKDFQSHSSGALTQLGAGDSEGYRKTCVGMLEQFGETKDWSNAYMTAWTCALSAGAVPDFSLPISLAEQAVQKLRKNWFRRTCLGAVLYRSGQFDEALVQLNEADVRQGDPKSDGVHLYPWYFLAMTHHALGNKDEARKWYEKATDWRKETLAPASEDGTPKPSFLWIDRLTLELLQSEVSEMLEVTAEPTTTVTEPTEEDPDQ